MDSPLELQFCNMQFCNYALRRKLVYCPLCAISWLVVKNWLRRKKRKIALARRRQWRKYWVLLRGTRMLFYSVPLSIDTRTAAVDYNLPQHSLGRSTRAISKPLIVWCLWIWIPNVIENDFDWWMLMDKGWLFSLLQWGFTLLERLQYYCSWLLIIPR